MRLGLDACDAAAAGLNGPADVLEHPDGFLAHFATVPLPEAVDADLGASWHTETLSFKVHPGGPGLDAAVDCALELHGMLGAPDLDRHRRGRGDHLAVHDAGGARPSAYLDGPASPVSALVFSTPYAVATTLLTGNLTPADFAPPAVLDPRRWQLAGKVRVVQDREMTRDSLVCEVPFGEALRQAGERATSWLAQIGTQRLVDLVGESPPPSASFERAEKVTPARVSVQLSDGRRFVRERAIPVGAAGAETRRTHEALVRRKFLGTGGSAEVADAAASLELMNAVDLRHLLQSALTTS